jgi:hypothetical protein
MKEIFFNIPEWLPIPVDGDALLIRASLTFLFERR